MFKTYYPKGTSESRWLLVDVNDQILGRVATQIAALLMGKHKATFTPGADEGDFVVVINARHVNVTGQRLNDKFYNHHSGYPGGLKTISLRDLLAKNPEKVIRQAVWGMLPHNKYARRIIKKLKVYAENEHPHTAQNPEPYKDL